MREYFSEKLGLYYRKNDWRPGRKSLVFIHGVSASSSAYLRYDEKFKTDYNVLFFDLRGHGKSAKSNKYEDYEIKNLANDLFELVTELGLQKFVLISHSFGTLVALEFLAKHQNMAEKIIFLSPIIDNNKLFGLILKPFVKIAVWLDNFRFSPKPAGHVDYSKYPMSGEWSARRLWADVKNTGLRVYLYCVGQMYKFDGKNLLEKIAAPTLIIHGKKDGYSSVGNAFYMAGKIKNSELHVIPDADHIIVLNNFDEVSAAMEKFIGK